MKPKPIRIVVTFSALPSGVGTYFAHFKDTGTSNFRARLYVTTTAAAPGRFRVGIANVASATPTTIIPTDLALGVSYVLVVRYNVANPASTLWINPAAESDTVNRVDATDSTTFLAITNIALRQSFVSPPGNGMGTLTLDCMRIGTTFADVSDRVPPSLSCPGNITVTASSPGGGGQTWSPVVNPTHLELQPPLIP